MLTIPPLGLSSCVKLIIKLTTTVSKMKSKHSINSLLMLHLRLHLTEVSMAFNNKRAGDVSPLAESLLSMPEALGLVLGIT